MIWYITFMKVHFSSTVEFLNFFKNEEACVQYFSQRRFRNGKYCVHCGHEHIYGMKGVRFRCSRCKKDFTLKTNTIFGKSKLPILKWFIAIHLLTINPKGISSVKIAKHINVSQKTASFIKRRIYEIMNQDNVQPVTTVDISGR